MKKLILTSTLIATTTLMVNPAFAARSDVQQSLVEGGTFSTLTILGTVVGGPVGMALGAVTGAYLADQTRVANEKSIEVETMQASITTMESQIEQKQREIAALEQATVDKLAFQVMFETGEDSLNDQDISRVRKLARHLTNNPKLVVSLDGHADPRGTDEYNNVLAHERAITVKMSLIAFGVEESRIIVHGHGASFSSADKGDLDGYALERRVDIELSDPEKDESLVQH